MKVTASKYPFPTVCADRSSTDWFQSISRTLKWNERERQKSFVVVEENPSKKHPKKTARAPAAAADATEELVGDDEEDEVSDDDEEEDEGFDIDVVEDDAASKANATKSAVTIVQDTLLQPHEHQLGSEKAREDARAVEAQQARAEAAAHALAQGTTLSQPGGVYRSGLHSGIDSPNRFLNSHPNPPLSARHVAFAAGTVSPAPTQPGRPVHSPLAALQADRESLKTPTGTRAVKKSRSRSREPRQHAPPPPTRAFAVYGQDESESESNASGDDLP